MSTSTFKPKQVLFCLENFRLDLKKVLYLFVQIQDYYLLNECFIYYSEVQY